MERKLKPIYVQKTLKEKGIRLFSPDEFQRVFSVSMRAAQEFIKDHKQDLFIKLRNGLYALQADCPGEPEIANRLYQPSYISFEYALSHYGMIPETVYSITSATPRITRSFKVMGKAYDYYHIKRDAYQGYHPKKKHGITTLIAEPEKALVDYLYFVSLGLRSLNERLYLKKVRRKILFDHARQFKRKSFLKLIKDVL
jgi:predicted transcriptional regulator of viral defense system